MTPDWWQRVYELFNEALRLAPEDRQALLEARCAGDPELRAEVERLLTRDAEAERLPGASARDDARWTDGGPGARGQDSLSELRQWHRAG